MANMKGRDTLEIKTGCFTKDNSHKNYSNLIKRNQVQRFPEVKYNYKDLILRYKD